MIEIVSVLRWINLALLAALLVGLVLGWWQHRDERVDPFGIALFAFALAGIYGTGESIVLQAPPGARPLGVTASALVALICVYVPLYIHHRDHRRNQT